MAGSNIEVELRLTDGAKENLRLLDDANSGIQIGFMQDGVSHGKLAPDLLSLGRIDYQIFWLFYPTGETLTDLAQLKGKRIAMGPVDSGDRAVCEKILAAAGINYDNTTLLAAKAVDDGAVDAVSPAFSPISSVSFCRAARLTSHAPFHPPTSAWSRPPTWSWCERKSIPRSSICCRRPFSRPMAGRGCFRRPEIFRRKPIRNIRSRKARAISTRAARHT
jgi:hypothetical protein